MQAFILAGGKGTRLSSITKGEVAKPMAEICGKPIIAYVLQNLKDNGITDIIISVGFLKESIMNFVKDGGDFGVSVSYVEEDQPLGSGGALYYLKGKVKDDFIVCPVDAIFDVDFSRMEKFHKEKGGLITLLTHPNLHPYDSDLIVADKNGLVTKFYRKNEERDFYYKNCVNAGIIMINARALDGLTEPKKMNMEHDFVAPFIAEGKVYSYSSCEYVKDVGTADRFELASKEIDLGIPHQKNLKNKQKAVFLDRDGTINAYRGFIKSAEEISLLPTVEKAIGKLNKSGYLAIIISNQPVIARGEATFQDVEQTFDKIETLLGKSGVYIDGVYYCPHHPHSGFEGEVKSLKFDCDCRKPKIGLIQKAVSDFNLDLSKCYMVGDSDVDVLTGKNANIKTVRVETGVPSKEEITPDFIALTLEHAIDLILKDE